MHQLTKQEIFDTVVAHAHAQKYHSFFSDSDDCAYRGMNDTKCFIGALITDDEYDEKMEYSSAVDLIDANLFPARLIFDGCESFYNSLQCIHDLYDVEDWESEFKLFAERYALKYESP